MDTRKTDSNTELQAQLQANAKLARRINKDAKVIKKYNRRQVKKLHAKNQTAEKEIDRNNAHIDSNSEKITGLQNKKQIAENQKSTLIEEAATHQAKLTEYQNKLADINQAEKDNEPNRNFAQERQDLKQAYFRKDGKIEGTLTDNQKEEIQKLRKQLNEIQEKIKAARKAQAPLDRWYHEQAARSLQAKIDQRLNDPNHWVKQKQKEIRGLDRKIIQLTSQNRRLNNRCEQLANNIKDRSIQIKQYESNTKEVDQPVKNCKEALRNPQDIEKMNQFQQDAEKLHKQNPNRRFYKNCRRLIGGLLLVGVALAITAASHGALTPFVLPLVSKGIGLMGAAFAHTAAVSATAAHAGATTGAAVGHTTTALGQTGVTASKSALASMSSVALSLASKACAFGSFMLKAAGYGLGANKASMVIASTAAVGVAGGSMVAGSNISSSRNTRVYKNPKSHAATAEQVGEVIDQKAPTIAAAPRSK